MKTAIFLSFLACIVGGSLAAQGWTSQIGVTGGMFWQKPAGTGQSDLISGWRTPYSGSTVPGLFIVTPLKDRVAFEFGLAASHDKLTEASGLFAPTSSSDVRLTGRADLLLGGGAYVGIGGFVRRRQIDSTHTLQTGLVGALGYQRPIGPGLNMRIEGQWITQRKTDAISPSNVYAFVFGISRNLNSGGKAQAARHTFTPWRLEVGVGGGYVHDHLYGVVQGLYVDVHETMLYVPGSGGTAPPAMFFEVPLRGRLALDVGFALERTRQFDTTVVDGQLAPGLAVALYRGWYADVGGNLRYLEQTGTKGFAFAGAHVATGYRLPLTNAVESRVDVSYTAFKERANFPLAQNSLAVLLGVALALHD